MSLGNCKNCDIKTELEKYKKKYELAKSGLTDEERKILIEFICHEQLNHTIPNPNEGYESERYNTLEQLKIKIRTV